MFSWMSRWRRALTPGKRRKPLDPARRRDQSPELYPTLQVRLLEERRVFHGEAVVAPVEAPPPPPPTTTVSLDAGQNLLVQDTSASGQNDQLSIRLDASGGYYEIYDPTQLLQTDIAGATGNGTNRVYIPVEVVTGDKLIVNTGGGEDALAVDLTGGLGGKSLIYDGGAGEQDSLTLVGGSYESVGYLFAVNGSTQIHLGPTQFAITGVEPIFDYLTADSRQFTIGAGLAGMTLGDDAAGANGLSQLTTALGTSATFASPLHSLTLAAQSGGSGQTLAVNGLDGSYSGDLLVHAGQNGDVELSGNINLHGGDLRASGDTIRASGKVITQGATIEMNAKSALTITAEGVLENSAGQVRLDAGAEGTLQFSGRIDVRGLSAGQTGGTVHLLGWQVEVLGTASIDASGMAGGGTVLVGGDYQGANPLIRNATNTLVQADTSIKANALDNGDGGKIIIWADEAAVVAGSGNLQARGGANGGDGGFIETSGKQYLEVRGAADASSPYGYAGTWLLDPINLTVVDDVSGSSKGQLDSGTFESSSGDTEIEADTIEAALAGGTDVILRTGSDGGGAGNLTVDEPIIVNLNDNTPTLTLIAHGMISINDAITASNGDLTIVLNANPDMTPGAIVVAASITTSGGNFSTIGSTFENTAAIVTGGGNVTLNHTGMVTIGANIQAGSGTATITGAGIDFDGNSALTARIATLDATTGAITGGTATADITVSGAAAAVSLTGTAIGTSTNRLVVNPGAAGTLALNATSGDILVDLAGGDFSTSRITSLSAGGTGADITLRVTAGDLTINNVAFADDASDNTSNDDFVLASSTGDVVLSNTSALVAATVSLQALGDPQDDFGDITATTASLHLSTSGAIEFLANGTIGTGGMSGIAIGVQAAGMVTANTSSTTASDGVFLTSTGPLSLGAVSTRVTTTGDQQVRITTVGTMTVPTPALTVAASSASDDDWTLVSAGDIIFSGDIAVAGESLTLTADGAIDFGSAALTGTETATLWAKGGDIDFGTDGSLTAVSASLTAGGAILSSAADAADINTSGAAGIVVSADSLGDASAHLQLNPGTGALDLTATDGGVFIQLTSGDLDFDLLTLDVQQADQQISLATKDGDISVTDDAVLSNTDDDDWSLSAGGTDHDIIFTRTTALDSDDLSLSATRHIGSQDDPFLMQPTGSISAVSGTGDIYLEQPSGDLDASDFANLDSDKTDGGIVSITAAAGDFTFDDATGFDDLADDTLRIAAKAGGTAEGNIAFETTLTAGEVELTADGDITSATGAGLDIDADGITLTAGGGIGLDGERLEVDPGSGTLSVTTSGSGAVGSIYLQSSADLDLSAFTTDDSPQTVDLVTAGNISISSLIDTDDDWLLNAAGDITFNMDGSLTAGSASLSAGGAINGGGTLTDIDTSAVGGDITLSGTSVGATKALRINPGTGAVDVTATSGGVGLAWAGGDLVASDLTLDVQGANQTIALSTTDGSFVFDDLSTFTNTSDDDFFIETQGTAKNIEFAGTFTLVARKVSLIATGSIISGGATADLNVTGDITLVSGAGADAGNVGDIGASGNEFRYEPAGSVSATADGDIYLRQVGGDLATSSITTLISTKAGGTVSIGATSGAVDVDDTAGWSLNDSLLEVVSQGAITLNDTLTAGAVRLLATGAIEGNAGAATDIDTSGGSGTGNANRSITFSGTSIGATAPIQINPGTGAVSATATTGGVALVLEGGDFLTSKLTLNVQAANQTIALTAADGRFVFDGVAGFTNTADDNFVVAAQGTGQNIDFTGTTTLVARDVSLTASGSITSGDAVADLNNTGTITLVSGDGGGTGDIGASGNEFRYEPAGSVIATADGNIYLRQVGGDLFTSSFATLTSTQPGGVVSIGTTSGNVFVNGLQPGFNVTDDRLEVAAGGAGSIFFQTTLSAQHVTLNAGGNIVQSGLPVDVIAPGGVDLIAGGGITIGSGIFSVQAGTGAVTAATSGTGSAGDILLLSRGALNLGSVTTDTASTQFVGIVVDGDNLTITQPNGVGATNSFNDDWFLQSIGGNIAFDAAGQLIARSATLFAESGQINGGASTTTDIDTSAFNGTITLVADSIGTGQRLQLDSGAGQMRFFTDVGGVFATYDGGELRTSRLLLDVAAGGQPISLHSSAGAIVFDSTAGFQPNTLDDNFQFQTLVSGGNISFTGATLSGQAIEIIASGSILGGIPGTAINAAGNLTLTATGDDIGAPGTPLVVAAGGQFFVSAADDIYLRVAGTSNLLTSQFSLLQSLGVGDISIGNASGAVTVNSVTGDGVTVGPGFLVDNDSLEIVSTAGGDITLGVPLVAGNLRLQSAAAILSTNTAPVDLTATGSGGLPGNIALVAVGPIGEGTNPISVSAAGQITGATTAVNGNIYITSPGPLSLGAFTTNTATTQTVFLETTGGGFSIATVNTTNDNWILRSAANIDFTGTGRLNANSVDLLAGGVITSTTAGANIATNGGLIALNGTSIGTAADSLKLLPGGGPLLVTARTGGVHLDLLGGDFSLSQFALLNLQADGAILELNTPAGSLRVNQTLGTTNDHYEFSAAANIVFSNNATLAGRSAVLTAANILNDSPSLIIPNINTSAFNGPITLHATGNLGASGQPLRVQPGTSGNLNLTADLGNIYVEVLGGNVVGSQLKVSAGGANQVVSLDAANGSFDLDPISFDLNTIDDRLQIAAATNITFIGKITAAGLQLTAGDSIVSAHDSTEVDADVAGLLDMTADTGDIGADGNPLVFQAAKVNTNSGDDQFLWLDGDSTEIGTATGNNISLLNGTFYLQNSVTASGVVTIAENVTFGGGGRVSASLVRVDGILSPGFFDPNPRLGITNGDPGQLEIIGDVTVSGTGVLIFDINSPYVTPGTDFDQILINGTLTLGDSTSPIDSTARPRLLLRGGTDLQQSIQGLQLLTGNVEGMFRIDPSDPDNALTLDDGDVKVKLGNFSGSLIVNGPTTGILIGNLSLVPPLQPINFKPPVIRLPVFTNLVRPAPPVQPPPPLPPPSPPPPLEFESEHVQLRYLEVRIVIPTDDEGHFREEAVMTLPADMLTDLPALLRRLPDDRYRIYLMLEGSAEERLVIDVLVRDGRPMEPDAGEAAVVPEIAVPPVNDHHDGQQEPAALPAAPAAPAAAPLPLTPPAQASWDGGEQAPVARSGRLFVGVAAAAVAVAAGRSAARWSEQVDAAAEQIGRSQQPRWGWWRRGTVVKDASRHN